MKVVVKRFKSNKNASISTFAIDGKVMCFGVEDEPREEKVPGETRVPAGIYDLGLRAEGGFHNRYLKKFPAMHKGMICVYNAPDWKIITPTMQFQYILLHVGNYESNTDGCYLTNQKVDAVTLEGSGSVAAYKLVYPIIVKELMAGNPVSIEYIDEDLMNTEAIV